MQKSREDERSREIIQKYEENTLIIIYFNKKNKIIRDYIRLYLCCLYYKTSIYFL
jgi:hypothetical protein